LNKETTYLLTLTTAMHCYVMSGSDRLQQLD